MQTDSLDEDGAPVTLKDNMFIYFLTINDHHRSVRLAFTEVTKDDAGYYFCRGNNSLDTVQTDKAYLEVVEESKYVKGQLYA